jgi:hypothetical protein
MKVLGGGRIVKSAGNKSDVRKDLFMTWKNKNHDYDLGWRSLLLSFLCNVIPVSFFMDDVRM